MPTEPFVDRILALCDVAAPRAPGRPPLPIIIDDGAGTVYERPRLS
jgi:hypothetical protein